jgi:hypothetical protein
MILTHIITDASIIWYVIAFHLITGFIIVAAIVAHRDLQTNTAKISVT